MYNSLIRPLLFSMDPESAHHLAMRLASVAASVPFGHHLLAGDLTENNKGLGRETMGLRFTNPVGLAAGFDKDARYLTTLEKMGFGFLELGTVTPRPQIGNPRPRLFRLPQDKALINRMGFNNDGVDAMVRRLEKRRNNAIIVGGNIGKNKDTANEEAYKDYLICFEKLYDAVDYFVVNVSSPNTPGLRSLQEREPLRNILMRLQEVNVGRHNKPIALKIAPDLENSQVAEVCELAIETGLAGLVLTNTTVSREGLQTQKDRLEAIGAGGLSGKPVFERSNSVLGLARQWLPKHISLIGVGGIMEPKDALVKFKQGADLVQIYTGFVYFGPGLPAAINKLILNGYDID
jgi:dihydroorotate dehydrogenase